jgi:hypothetical protein
VFDVDKVPFCKDCESILVVTAILLRSFASNLWINRLLCHLLLFHTQVKGDLASLYSESLFEIGHNATPT